MRRKKATQQDVPTAGGGKVTPTDVQQIEFRLAFRGYKEGDVDAFLDRVTEDLAWYLEENQRLRAAGVAPVAAEGSADLDATRIEAEGIVAAARAEAAEIVRTAEREAGAIRAAGSVPGDARASVAPFLGREREFLQGLGALVQAHAEEVKQMVLALRARAESARESSEPETTAPEVASAAEIRERLGEPEPPPQPPEPDRVIVDVGTEPAYSSEGAPVGEGGERSLRELFWGED